MSLKTSFCAALFAALAVATRKDGKPFAPGWCTFHLEEDAVVGRPPTEQQEHNVKLQFFDADKELFHTEGPTDWRGNLESIHIFPEGFPAPIKLKGLTEGSPGYIQGFSFEYDRQSWNTNQEPPCKAGKEAVRGFGWWATFGQSNANAASAVL